LPGKNYSNPKISEKHYFEKFKAAHSLASENSMSTQTISLKARALRYLSAREHSRQELAKKLARYATEREDINALLDQLAAADFLSDERFSESLVNRRSARFGNSRILHELKDHGIEGDALVEIKTKLEQDEVARATEVWRKKFGQFPGNSSERAKQMRFLQQRGFSHRAIQMAMRAMAEGDD
jgi:regulatory protein